MAQEKPNWTAVPNPIGTDPPRLAAAKKGPAGAETPVDHPSLIHPSQSPSLLTQPPVIRAMPTVLLPSSPATPTRPLPPPSALVIFTPTTLAEYNAAKGCYEPSAESLRSPALFKEEASEDLDKEVERIEDKNGDTGKSATDPSLNPETAAARAHGQAGQVKLSFAKHPGQVGLIVQCIHMIMQSLGNGLIQRLIVMHGGFPWRKVHPTNRVWQLPLADGPYKIRISLPPPYSVDELSSVTIPPNPVPIGSHGVDPDGSEFDADVAMETWATGLGTRQLELTITVPDEHNRACTVIHLEIPFQMGQLDENGRMGGPDLTAARVDFLMHIYAG